MNDVVNDESADASPARWYDRDRPVALVLTAWLLLIFGLIWNPWWMPSGDAEVFVVVARNLLLGRGLSFNGGPVAFIPPGWPLALAGLLHLTDQYLWLKAAQILNMLVFLLAAYAILRRFTPPRLAGPACALAGILWPLYPLTMWLHSDAMFCAIAALTGLIAVRWADGKLGRAWIVAIVLGCALGVVVRWAAVAQIPVLIALACGSGRPGVGRSAWWPHLTRRQAAGALVIFLATFGTFFALKYALRPADEPAPLAWNAQRAAAAAGGGLTLAALTVPEEVLTPDLFIGREDPDRTPLQEFAHRVLAIPQWFSWTLFFPLRVVDGLPGGIWLDRGVGLLAMVMLGVAAWHAARRRVGADVCPHYLWLGVLVYVVALGLNWPHVNNRYLVPIAPFLLAGILVGLGQLSRFLAFRLLRWSFVAAVLAINGALWSVDVLICRRASAEEFYARWEAGIYPSLIEVGTYLDNLPDVKDGQIVASERYQNLTERWEYPLSPRAMMLMTDKRVRSVPTPLAGWGVRKAQAWARETDARYYVQQNPTMPGRIWHFRVTPEIEEKLTSWPPARQRPQFELFTMQPDPIPSNPHLQSLEYQQVPVLRGEALERVTRRVPHLDG